MPGIAPLPLGPASAAQQAGGNIANGTYYYAVTALTPTGETIAGQVASVTVSGGPKAVALSTIPTGPAGTTARNIYRTKSGGLPPNFFFVGTLFDNATTTFTDTLADAALGGNLVEAGLRLAGSDATGYGLFLPVPPFATANFAVLSIGYAPWDGATSGYFQGSSSGTCIAINTPGTYAGDVLTIYHGGTKQAWIDFAGYLYANRLYATSGNTSLALMGAGAGGVAFNVFSGTGGVTFYDGASNAKATVRSDGLADFSSSSAATKVKAGVPADADWTVAPPNGTIVIDSTDGRLYFRYGGAWHYVTQTA